jgi:electron-transferring-flavoprotein dehydrogenase
MGIDIVPGFAATELLFDDAGNVKGVATGDMGVNKDGEPGFNFAPGMELHAKYTLIAEGARGSLAKELIAKFELDKNSDPQHFGLGIKEIWEVDPTKHREGHVEHHLGWPLSNDTGGGGFVYHAENNQVFLGFVTHLNYSNPHISPFDEMQKWKTHPRMQALLEGGTRIGYGARALTEGGWQSIPQLAFPGGALMGCAAGFMNVPRIKGSHNAIHSGIKTAEAVFDALEQGRGNDTIEKLNRKVTAGAIENDLKPVRNAKPLLKYGTMLGTLLSGFDLWTNSLFKFSVFGTLRSPKPDHAYLKPARDCKKPDYPKPDNTLTFDRTTSVFLANLAHEEEQPVHLKLADPDIPVTKNLPLYDEPAQRYCPAGVYEIVTNNDDQPRFQINAANCVHCNTCDIKDPAQNIKWVPPEGASGPNYQGM